MQFLVLSEHFLFEAVLEISATRKGTVVYLTESPRGLVLQLCSPIQRSKQGHVVVDTPMQGEAQDRILPTTFQARETLEFGETQIGCPGKLWMPSP